MESKRVGTFKQFLKQKLNEGNVSIECDFWDEAQVRIIDILTQQCQGNLSWDALVKYVKNKNQMLGKEDPGYDEALLLQHIKDLIFQLYGDSLYTSALCDWGENNSEIQAKGLVVSELAKVIFEKVLDTRKSPDDPVPGTISLIDKDKTMGQCDDGDCYDDLPFEGKKTRPVKKFWDYTKSLNETVAFIDMPAHKKCINYCLDRIQNEVGSYDPDEIFNMACQEAKPKAKARMVLLYVKNMVTDYIANEKALFGMVDVTGKKGKDIPKEAWEEGLDILCHNIADEVLVALADINGISVEDAEVE